MSRPLLFPRARAPLAAVAGGALLAVSGAGCGQGKIDVEPQSRSAAVLFNQRCSGCHSLKAANAYGSKPEDKIPGGERTNGPNFNVRKVAREDVLFAIRNGGFSGAIMPANIVVGQDADKLAEFLSKYSGKDRSSSADTANPSQSR